MGGGGDLEGLFLPFTTKENSIPLGLLPAVIRYRAPVQVPEGEGVHSGTVPLQPPLVQGVCNVKDLPTPNVQCVRVHKFQEGEVGTHVEGVTRALFPSIDRFLQRQVS